MRLHTGGAADETARSRAEDLFRADAGLGGVADLAGAAARRVATPGRHERVPEARCPIRPGEPCTLCQVSVTGPEDCGLAYLVMSDPDLREELRRSRLAHVGSARSGGR